MKQEVIRQLNQRLSAVDASFWDVHPLEVSELYDRLNDSEQTGLKLLFVLSVVCLLISVFGVYAVATATMKRRRKEIAIRKVYKRQGCSWYYRDSDRVCNYEQLAARVCISDGSSGMVVRGNLCRDCRGCTIDSLGTN